MTSAGCVALHPMFGLFERLPVYERTGGHAYGSVYPGPIGAILTPQLRGTSSAVDKSLPFASSLCGACFDVCPVRIDIPSILVHLRTRVVDEKRGPVPTPEALGMRTAAWMFADHRRLERAQRLAARVGRLFRRKGHIGALPGPLSAWSGARDTRLLLRRASVTGGTASTETTDERPRRHPAPRPFGGERCRPQHAAMIEHVYGREVSTGSLDRVDRFCERVDDYRATVVRCAREDVGRSVRDALTDLSGPIVVDDVLVPRLGTDDRWTTTPTRVPPHSTTSMRW